MATVGRAFPPVVYLDDQSAREVFRAVVIDIGPAKLAKAMRVSKECARQYKQGRKFPGGKRLIHGARNLPEVRAWLYYEVERDDEGFDSDRSLTGTYQRVAQLASTPGKQGDEARRMLSDMARLAAKGGDA